MVRSFEKSCPGKLSKRARINGRIPIIAVSASLVEKDRQIYIDAGFDAWILKPIDIKRLDALLTGIVSVEVRRQCLYKAGCWEQGGWFRDREDDIFGPVRPLRLSRDLSSGGVQGSEHDTTAESGDAGASELDPLASTARNGHDAPG